MIQGQAKIRNDFLDREATPYLLPDGRWPLLALDIRGYTSSSLPFSQFRVFIVPPCFYVIIMSTTSAHTTSSVEPPRERSRNAKAQARHRAKRKAYIEQVSWTSPRHQPPLNVDPLGLTLPLNAVVGANGNKAPGCPWILTGASQRPPSDLHYPSRATARQH
jgi:hypothetical protein